MKKSLFIIAALVITSLSYGQDKIFAPTPISPADSAINQMADALVDFSSVAGAQSYEIQFDLSETFSNPLKVFTTYSAGNGIELLYNTFYHWRARSIGNPGDTSAWSSIRTFTVIDIPSLITPVDSTSDQPISLKFSWQKITGSNGYDIMIDTVATFSSPVVKTVSTNNIDTARIALYYYGENFYCKIRAYHSKDTTAWSAPTYFRTRKTPIIKTPVDSVVDAIPTVLLQFKSIIGSTHYEYEYSTFSDFSASTLVKVPLSAQIIIYPTHPSNRDTVMQVAADTLPFAEMVYWRARAMSLVDTSVWSSVYRINVIPAVKTLYSPAEGVTTPNTVPTFKWSKINGCTHYELECSPDPAFITDVRIDTILHPTTTHDTVFFSVTHNLIKETMYYWRVRACNTRYNSNWKDSHFTTGVNLSVTDFSLENNLFVYPNPCKERLNVQINTQHSMEYNIVVNNIIGQTVLSKTGALGSGKTTIPFNMTELNNGIYFISVQTGNQNVTRKVILEK